MSLRINLFIFTLIMIVVCRNAYSVNTDYQNTIRASTGNPVKFLDSWEVAINDDQTSENIPIPKYFNSNVSKIALKTEFEIPDSLSNFNLELHFTGIQGYCKISLNKNLILTHPSYPSPFVVQIPIDWVKSKGKNYLEVLITHPQDASEGFPEYVHIFQPRKTLAVTGEIYIVWIKDIHYKDFAYNYKDNKLNINYNLVIDKSDTLRNGKYSKLRFLEKVSTLTDQVVFSRFEYIDFRKQNKNLSRSVGIKNPKLWSPDSPELYKVELSAYAEGKQIAYYSKIIGLKNIQIKRGTIYLNDQVLQVKGITYRPEYDEALTAIPQIEYDLKMIKDIGFNAIRVPNSMLHPTVASLTDSIGLLLSFENNVWRVPVDYFSNDNLLQMAKQISSEILNSTDHHPSLFSIGLGTELALQESSIQKYTLILGNYLQQKYQILTHVTPLDYSNLPVTDLTDIYLINAYHDAVYSALNFIENKSSNYSSVMLLGNVGFPAEPDTTGAQIAKFADRLNAAPILKGLYIESFRDWAAKTNSSLVNSENYYPYGLFNYTGVERPQTEIIRKLLSGNHQTSYYASKSSRNKTNFFSLSVFITGVIFFLIYRQNFRLRDNIKRSLSHSYGFYVDLRDRRIIALLNSFIIGLFTNLLVANVIAAYLYYFRNSIYIEEIMNTILSPFELNNLYNSIIQYPFLLLLLIWSLFFFGQVLIAAILKLLNILSEEKIRFKQTVAVCNWAGVPLLFLIPVSLICYQLIIPDQNLHIFLFLTMVVFFIWYNIRLANGIRVLMIMPAYKVFAILLLTYSIVFFIFFAFLESNSDFFGYINLLIQGKILFF